jgi:hypothetical protein
MTVPSPDRYAAAREQAAGWLHDFAMRRAGHWMRWAYASIAFDGGDDHALREQWRVKADQLLRLPAVAALTDDGPVRHNHTRFRNDDGPWSACPATCPAAPRTEAAT